MDKFQGWVYPLEKRAFADPTQGKRYFGAPRNGNRVHAGMDLLAIPRTDVIAMTDGTVIEVSTTFYAGTGAIAVKNDDGTVVRYCEIDPSVKAGDKVKKGQVIGQVIANTASGSSMLHLEMYMGTEKGSLTQPSNSENYKYVPVKNYQRRADLINPTIVKNLPLIK